MSHHLTWLQSFGQDAREAVPKLAADAKAFLDAYCRGVRLSAHSASAMVERAHLTYYAPCARVQVNFYLEEHSNFWEQPLEFLMIQHR
jgi:hypothetical protein